MNHELPGLPRVLRCASSWLWLTIIVTASLQAAEPTREQIAFFENEIRPLLVKHCYECHSDEKKLEGELRVNGRAALLHGGASGPAVVPGKPSESLMIEAVKYRSLEMPPNGKLPDADVAKLVRWVEIGLPWPAEKDSPEPGLEKKEFQFTEEQLQHWSFQPISNPVPPEVNDPDWSRNLVDRFLFRKFQEQGLQPNPLAGRETLLRRVTYDLTGLPPSRKDLHDFLADQSPEAWTKVIDRLLASPHYGEHWGRHWMDVVRYADTSGNASDHPVPDAYKYRNYVIDSLNQDKPYDQFLREQYAGDLLARDAPPEQYEEFVTATGQLAIARRFGFNDTNFLDFHLTLHDLLDTMGQSVLGLTIGCARCHDHKFEPISAKDYYALYGIFSSTKFTFPGAEEVKYPKDLIPALPPQQVEILNAARQAAVSLLDQRIAERELPLVNFEGNLELGKQWPAGWKRDADAQLVENSSSPFTNVFPAGNQSVQLPNSPKNLGFRRPLARQTPETREPFHFNIDFRNISIDAGGDGYYRIALDHPSNRFSPAVELFVNGSHLAIRDQGSWKEIAPLIVGTWYNLQVEVNWSAKTFSGVLSDGTNFWNFTDAPLNSTWDGIVDSWVVDGAGTDSQHARPLREIDNLFVQSVPFPSASEMAPVSVENLQSQIAALRAEVESLKKEKETLTGQLPYPTVYGVHEGKPADARLQFRGEPDRLGEAVPRGFLTILGGEKLSPDCQESGRRELAEWLTSPDNPLTARVMVNRIWLYYFGRGIVATPNDFGVRGERPTHPELLDSLATTFRNEGYSLKAMHRLILTSRAYQLSSSADSHSATADPANTWFWRHNRRRLDAESLRDSWLMLSGKLDVAVGGAHPFPPVSQWKFSQHNPFDAVYKSNQRTVYLMTQRIKRHPFLAIFDGADPNATTGKRDVTTTPAQALFMMNDDFFHELSQSYAQQVMKDSFNETQQVIRIFEEVYSRSATREELEAAHQFRQRYLAMLGKGDNGISESLAAYLRVILSSNEFLYLQ